MSGQNVKTGPLSSQPCSPDVTAICGAVATGARCQLLDVLLLPKERSGKPSLRVMKVGRRPAEAGSLTTRDRPVKEQIVAVTGCILRLDLW
jgi:hypothetical protein